jgi:hypothetical protein
MISRWPSVRIIVHRHRHRIAALAALAALAAERVYFAPHIEVLEPDHPERRFVSALCLYSDGVDTGRAGWLRGLRPRGGRARGVQKRGRVGLKALRRR